jgi:hypothetical protein
MGLNGGDAINRESLYVIVSIAEQVKDPALIVDSNPPKSRIRN